MSFTSISLFIDVVGSLLLAAVIFYTIRLNQHFQMLQKNRAELARQLSGFAHSTERAETAISQVRQSTKESAQQMEDLLKRGEMLKQDLGYLVDRANGLADRLEGGVRRERDAGATAAPTGRASRRAAARTPQPVEEAPALEKGTSSRRARRTEPKVEETPAPEEALSSKRRRRRAASEDSGEAKSNSELLKVLQGMR